MSRRFLAIRRDNRFSPNSIDNDRLILVEVLRGLKRDFAGDDFCMVDEEDFSTVQAGADVCLSMARSHEALTAIAQLEATGCLVVNSSLSVSCCVRERLDRLMRVNHIAMPPLEGENGYWLKRGDEAAQSKSDVVYCPDVFCLEQAKNDFRSRGIYSWVVSAHVKGDLVKFYGVGHCMFKYFYPGDDGISKFGDERMNGIPHHYAFDLEALRSEVMRLAQLTGVIVYGGDAIIDAEGHFFIIDFNDWPSFSRCRDEAARAIVATVEDMM